MAKNYAEQVMRDHCSITWVIEGETIRDTTNEERFALRDLQAQRLKAEAPLPYAEINGISYKPSASGQESTRQSARLVQWAHRFCAAAIPVDIAA